mmetsp:Transcript_48974/g.91804  ORF Transcript_48974/g.91804 Transcript_48974/m.91804 type:complete len:132 (-) Transcript_48974:278-673(-)
MGQPSDLAYGFLGYTAMYACLVLFGGVMGFVKAKSKASLIASTIVSLVLLGLMYLTLKVNMLYGGVGTCVFSLVLVRMFKQKYDKSGEAETKLSEPMVQPAGKKFMPFGLLTVLGLVEALLAGYLAFSSSA